jgi:hypothetical protein
MDAADARHGPPTTTLRGATLVSAPFTLVGIAAAALAVATVAWVFGSGNGATPSATVTAALAGAVAAAGFLGARGCRVRVVDGELRDQVAWRTAFRIRASEIRAIRVRAGAWRTFEMELPDGTRRVVLGAGPVQFPATLLPGAADRDLAAIDAMLCEART